VAQQAPETRPSVPSLAFEQCCGVARTAKFLEVLSDHFREARSPRASAQALVDVATR